MNILFFAEKHRRGCDIGVNIVSLQKRTGCAVRDRKTQQALFIKGLSLLRWRAATSYGKAGRLQRVATPKILLLGVFSSKYGATFFFVVSGWVYLGRWLWSVVSLGIGDG